MKPMTNMLFALAIALTVCGCAEEQGSEVTKAKENIGNTMDILKIKQEDRVSWLRMCRALNLTGSRTETMEPEQKAINQLIQEALPTANEDAKHQDPVVIWKKYEIVQRMDQLAIKQEERLSRLQEIVQLNQSMPKTEETERERKALELLIDEMEQK